MNEITQSFDLDQVEAHMLTLPAVECPVEHLFGPNIYIRQVFMPKGAYVIGHEHKLESINMVLSGSLALIEGGAVRVVEAPYFFVGKAGRKIAYVIEDCVFQNIFSTPETDIDKLEEMIVVKSNAFLELEGAK